MKSRVLKMNWWQIVVVILLAIVAAFALFVHAPEMTHVVSVDGRVEFRGNVPQSFGNFAILAIKNASSFSASAAPIYTIEPHDVLLPSPLELSFSYAGFYDEPLGLSIALWNEEVGRWEPIASFTDYETKTVHANLTFLTSFTLIWQ